MTLRFEWDEEKATATWRNTESILWKLNQFLQIRRALPFLMFLILSKRIDS